MLRCPLCHSDHIQPYFSDKKRDYSQCLNCELVFVPETFHLNDREEKAEYDLHQNQIDDEGYRSYLSPVVDAVLSRLPIPSMGLDFGCGPGPALSAMLKEQGYQVACYDKFYTSDDSVLNSLYDFITCTEVIEHLADPAAVLDQQWRLLKPKGWLIVMTQLVISPERFSQWGYKNDPTHIGFYSRTTMTFIGRKLNTQIVEYPHRAVVCFQKARTDS